METKERNVKGIYVSKKGKYYGTAFAFNKLYYTKFTESIEDAEKLLVELRQKLQIDEIRRKIDKEINNKKNKNIILKKCVSENYNFEFKHTGAEGQRVYSFTNNIYNKYLYMELIENPVGCWAYHVESRGNLVCDSRISNRYYDSMVECIKAMDASLKRKFYRQKS